MGRMQKLKLAPGVAEEMLNPNFWLNSEDEKQIMSRKEINNFNQLTSEQAKKLNNEQVFLDLENYEDILSSREIEKIMDNQNNSVQLQKRDYYNREGRRISKAEKKVIIENLNQQELDQRDFEIKDKNESSKRTNEKKMSSDKIKVDFAVLIRRSNLKKYPTDTLLAPDENSTDQDLNQLTALSVGTPCAVLGESRDEKWFFVQAKLYTGWIKRKDTALADDKEQALSYLKSERFLVVTESFVQTEPNPFAEDISNILFQMGDKIPLLEDEEIPDSIPENNLQAQSAEGCYAVWVPTRNKDGRLEYKKALLALSNGLSEGFLSYSRANIIRQAFKLLGERYGWGGLYQRRDCSRFVMDIYRTVGIELPRDSGLAQQKAAAGKTVELNGDISSKKKKLEQLNPGDALYMPGHVVIYLGRKNGRDYIIHSASGYSKRIDAEAVPVTVHGVFLMRAEELLKSGEKSYLEAFELARKFHF